MDNGIIALVVVLGIWFISRTLNERAMMLLSQEEKAKLIDLFSKSRIYSWGILILIVLLFFFNTKYALIDPFLNYVIYIGLILIFMAANCYLSYKKLKQNNFPDSYIKSYLFTISLRFAGIVIFSILQISSVTDYVPGD